MAFLKGKNKERIFKIRFATLLLAQAHKEYLKSKVPGFVSAGEVLASEEFADSYGLCRGGDKNGQNKRQGYKN